MILADVPDALGLELLGAPRAGAVFLPLVRREWKTGRNSSYNCTPFLDSLLTKGKYCRSWSKYHVHSEGFLIASVFCYSV